MSLPSSNNRIPQLDGIRGIAIFLVMIGHYYVLLVEPHHAYPRYFSTRLFAAVWAGVDLFFVLSGFLIGGILMDKRVTKNFFSVFYLRRVCRILPIYLLLLLVIYSIYFFVQWQDAPALEWLVGRLHPAWCYALFVQNFCIASADSLGSDSLGITWSLAIEEQFYIILPFMIRYIPPRVLPHVLGGIALLTPVWRVPIWFIPDFGRIGAYVMMPCRTDALLLGVLAAWWIRQPNFHAVFARWRSVLVKAAWIMLAGAILFSYLDGNFSSYLMVNIGYTWFALLFTLFLLLALTTSNRISLAILCFKPLCGLGIISYFVYLFHQVFLGLSYHFMADAEPFFVNAVLPMFVALTLTLGAATLSWRYFEKPFVRLGHRFHY